MPNNPPVRPGFQGLWHLALRVRDLLAMRAFYVDLLGYEVEWEPDADNVYLSSGRDNLALHQDKDAPGPGEDRGVLDHLGLVLARPEDVDAWAAVLVDAGHTLEIPVRTHRDGARSFYVRDPEGNLVQFLWHPPLAPPGS